MPLPLEFTLQRVFAGVHASACPFPPLAENAIKHPAKVASRVLPLIQYLFLSTLKRELQRDRDAGRRSPNLGPPVK